MNGAMACVAGADEKTCAVQVVMVPLEGTQTHWSFVDTTSTLDADRVAPTSTRTRGSETSEP